MPKPNKVIPNMFDSAEIKEAHKHSIRHRGELRDSGEKGTDLFFYIDNKIEKGGRSINRTLRWRIERSFNAT